MGSGTTGKMAIVNGRNFIGFEISKEYCDIANLRTSKCGYQFVASAFGLYLHIIVSCKLNPISLKYNACLN